MKQGSAFMNRLVRRLSQAAGTKYFLVLLLAGVWMFTFDRYNLLSQKKVDQQMLQYQQDIEYYKEAIQDLDYEKARLFSDEEALEQYVRENYYMKKSGEDIYILLEE